MPGPDSSSREPLVSVEPFVDVDVPVEREVAVVELSEGVDNCVFKRFLPFPQGALRSAKCLKFSMMSLAMKTHMPLGYAAVGAVWKPPFAFRPIIFSL